MSEGQQSSAAAVGGTICKKAGTHGDREPTKASENLTFPVRSFFSGDLVLTQTSRGYACALIVRSRAVDPRRTASMVEREEKARQHFEELKGILLELCLRCWKQEFKSYVDQFIAERLDEKDIVTVIPCEDEEEEELDRMYLHGLRRLVAGAVQEWELVQQPKHAAMCAELDSALVWQGRGYVSSILHGISLLLLSCRVNLRKFRQLYGW